MGNRDAKPSLLQCEYEETHKVLIATTRREKWLIERLEYLITHYDVNSLEGEGNTMVEIEAYCPYWFNDDDREIVTKIFRSEGFTDIVFSCDEAMCSDDSDWSYFKMKIPKVDLALRALYPSYA